MWCLCGPVRSSEMVDGMTIVIVTVNDELMELSDVYRPCGRDESSPIRCRIRM